MKRTAPGGAVERQYKFEDSAFERVRAHGGTREISFARVVARSRGSIRFIDLSVLGPGADIGCHTHDVDNEELYIVVSGRGWMTLDGHGFEVGPGHVILNRPGGTHGLRNIGEEELRIVVIEVESQPDNLADTP
jgi:mannose-6-phosphate isomerase-like protein (cupin superfamily)